MNILLTGGAGFIGRWVAKQLLEDGHQIWILDDLSNGSEENIREFRNHPGFKQFIKGTILDRELLESLFNKYQFEMCYHLGASINVQDSIDDPQTTFNNDTIGTFYLLEQSRKYNTKFVFMSTCMVYDRCADERGITELHPIKPASPYAGAKIAAENMVLSYYHAYGLPVVVVRPFNTYGPYQKTGGEGGVVAIFIKQKLNGNTLNIYGDGKQTRDLLYVSDCARFVVQAGYSDKVNGEIVNAGLGRDISVNELALLIAGNPDQIRHVEHIHPQSEIAKLLCNSEKAKHLLDWEPMVSLEEGIRLTQEWIQTTNLI
ncbi:dTDP-glucose 4,6-dehydratase [Paenibacillus apiarius]|uniref:GDP-mannose 4,6-dehydratase n=1 Tax=Paenibacillus apiarius TaxID=46240 RepID=A0ABT4DSG7_9BACL|nr:GDP-mannose 4,6-dehydratase [Paenibacillus apiarius]MCY9514175.1 GDP-mannose 4,6-dehydratase [Paenibacillus apiarius]MCY9520298.1 GDP-mannose 4,6-dehydratase [Paenibacillus apiarius]MCY9550360.1 GDP-mannose 4,6-dehydratase [Paenibacillus apiarius]MCY9557422.1 GDP-mannose 4,6-dehydratase [Paenibacillus apiarius]MCY9682399.1 GDP-mannose 4,6-dehydratase [Paenibacillus apiarius]